MLRPKTTTNMIMIVRTTMPNIGDKYMFAVISHCEYEL